MSRQNKVNPGMYTQRGRLTQDDAARELRKQREVGSQHTWQPVKKDQLPRFESKPEPSDEGTETTEDSKAKETAPAPDNAQPTKRMAKGSKPSPKAKAKSAQPKATQPKAAKTGGARKTAAKAKAAKTSGKAKTGKAKSAKAAKSAAKPAKRQAVLARNVGGLRLGSGQPRAESRGGGNPKPKAGKRRKS